MNSNDFYTRVSIHPDLKFSRIEGFGDDVAIVVRCLTGKLSTALLPKAVRAEDWERLEEILVGRHSEIVLAHMTRIVGYYSAIENWNKSKLGELAARRRGVKYYAIPEVASAKVGGARPEVER